MGGDIIIIIIDRAVNQSLDMIATFIFSFTIYEVIFHDDDDEHDEHSSLSLAALFCDVGRGAQMRTVASSEADANIDGYTGFHETQLTVRV